MITKKINACEVFLKELKIHIPKFELESLGKEAGFVYPNGFSIENIERILLCEKMPGDDFAEYIWAIYECNYENLERYSPWVRVLVSSVYTYCYKINQAGVSVQSDYFWLGIRAALDDESGNVAKFFFGFIDWLCFSVKPDDGYDDYYSWVSWLCLKKIINDSNCDDYWGVVNELLSREYDHEFIDSMDVSMNRSESWWAIFSEINNFTLTESSSVRKIIFGCDLCDEDR